MDARSFLIALALLGVGVPRVSAQILVAGSPASPRRTVFETDHFRVFAADPQLAKEVAETAEEYRRYLAQHWLGKELPKWMDKVPVTVQSSPNMPASGETKYTLVGGAVRNFQMVLCGSRERILDSVLPHEMTHTILATHFAASGKPVPRWADEGACTTVEHGSERSKHDTMLVRFLSEGRGIPFASLFAMREYPRDMMPLYAQGYSLCAFLIAQGGPRQFIVFLERGMRDEDWVAAVAENYGYPKLGKLQTAWNQWVSDGGGAVADYTALALGYRTPDAALASMTAAPMAAANALVASQPLPEPNRPVSTGPTNATLAMAPSAGFYQSQFQRHLGDSSNASSSAASATLQDPIAGPTPLPDPGRLNLPVGNGWRAMEGIPVHVGQPGPMQTMGGTLLR